MKRLAMAATFALALSLGGVSPAVALADGSAGAFELLPLLLLVAVPVVLGAQRWRPREIG